MPAPPEDPVRKAMNADDADAMKALVESGTISVNGIISDAPYIIWAATYKKKKVLNYLLDAGADVNIKRKGVPFIIFAVIMNDVNILEKAIEKGADINARGPEGAQPTPLIVAFNYKAFDAANVLIDADADLNVVSKGEGGGTALMFAVHQKNIELIKKLLEKGADVNAKNEVGKTCLMIVAERGYDDIIDIILEYKPDLNAQNNDGATALHYAAISNSWKVVRKLANAGANLNLQTETGFTPLHKAAVSASADSLLELLRRGADASIQTNNNETPLHFVMEFGTHQDADVVRRLFLRCPQCLTVREKKKGYTPLHVGVLFMKEELIESIGVLPQHPDSKAAAIKVQDDKGETPLTLAFDMNQPGITRLLIEMGGETDTIIPSTGLPLLPSAIKKNMPEMFKVLLSIFSEVLEEAGVQLLDKQLPDGKTALHIAAQEDRVDFAKKMIDKGASVFIKDNEGKLPKDYAKSSEMKEVLGAEDDTLDKYKGYSKSDAELFNNMFEEPKEWSCCPVCLAYVRRTDGCMYMHHPCKTTERHERLFQLYKDVRTRREGEIEWCTICGRITYGHKHRVLSLANSTVLPDFAPILAGVPEGVDRHFMGNCIRVGGGGLEEKVKRIHRILSYACELQGEVGKLSAKKARNELIEEAWNAPLMRNRAIPKMLENKKFDFPCTFPEDEKPAAPEAAQAYPDVLRPADEAELTPIKHEKPDNECAIELSAHADDRPVYQFQHKQPDGSIYKHESYVCGPDLEQLIRSEPIDGKCRIDPDKCTALLYPSELKDIVTPEFYETYRELFNKANARVGGRRRTRKRFRFRGGQNLPSIMKPLDMDTAECAPPQKVAAGKRRTYKKSHRKRHTKKTRY